jgi:hypothetical protein
MSSDVFENLWGMIKRRACWYGEIKNRKNIALLVI